MFPDPNTRWHGRDAVPLDFMLLGDEHFQFGTITGSKAEHCKMPRSCGWNEVNHGELGIVQVWTKSKCIGKLMSIPYILFSERCS